MQNLRLFLFIIFITNAFLFSSCGTKQLDTNVLVPVKNDSLNGKEVCVVHVFVHGTVLPQPSLFSFAQALKNFFSKNKKSQGVYQHYIEALKEHGKYRRQPVFLKGLCLLDLQKQEKRDSIKYYGQQTALLYKKTYDFLYPDHKKSLLFYLFGWSGRLDKKRRMVAAKSLYLAIQNEIAELKKKTDMPIKIVLLAHSHGGNVVLNLAQIEKEFRKGLYVDQVVFYGTPVQSETKENIYSSVFGDIYHVFSTGDHIQIADTISTKDFFSKRMFQKKEKNLPRNLHQITVSLAGKEYDFKPYHWELWLWGDKSFPYFFYRKDFPLYPLPVSVFSSVITLLANKLGNIENSDRLCQLFIDAEKEELVISTNGRKHMQHVPIKQIKDRARQVL